MLALKKPGVIPVACSKVYSYKCGFNIFHEQDVFFILLANQKLYPDHIFTFQLTWKFNILTHSYSFGVFLIDWVSLNIFFPVYLCGASPGARSH